MKPSNSTTPLAETPDWAPQVVYLSLDVSTTCTGVAAFDEAGHLLGTLAHKPTVSKLRPDSTHYVEKASGLARQLRAWLNGASIKAIWVEEPLSRANNQFTVVSLARYNGAVSYVLRDLFGVLPQYLSVYEWRRALCPEFVRVKGDVFSLPKGTDPKIFIYEKIARWFPAQTAAMLTYTKIGKVADSTYDQTDAVGVGLAGLLAGGVIPQTSLFPLPAPRISLQRGRAVATI